MDKVSVKMLKDGTCNVSNVVGDTVTYKKGDVIEIAEEYAEGMVEAGACTMCDVETEVNDEPEAPEFNLATAKAPELKARAAELGIDPTGTVAVLREAIEAALKPVEATEEPEGDDDEEISLDDLDREALIELIADQDLSIEVTDEVADEAIRDLIEAALDETEEKADTNAAPENKMLEGAEENK